MTRTIAPAAAAVLAFALLAAADLSAGGRREQGAGPTEGSMMIEQTGQPTRRRRGSRRARERR